jgi:hypothetical protein
MPPRPESRSPKDQRINNAIDALEAIITESMKEQPSGTRIRQHAYRAKKNLEDKPTQEQEKKYKTGKGRK